jgi:hypothetical protein
MRHFSAMWQRVRNGKVPAIYWSRDAAGFYAFLKCVGRIPADMLAPSIGRSDHALGYEPGNCGWQELSENHKQCLKDSCSRERHLAGVRGRVETPKRTRQRRDEAYQNGFNNYWKGRRFSLEHRAKLSVAAKLRGQRECISPSSILRPPALKRQTKS